MDFGLSDEQLQYRESLRGWLTDHLPTERVRAIMDSQDAREASLLEGLAAQGATAVMVPERDGGLGLHLLDAVVTAWELGRAAAPVSYHSAFVAAPILLAASDDRAANDWAARIAAGTAVVSIVEEILDADEIALRGTASFSADGTSADAWIAAVRTSERIELRLIPRDVHGHAVTALPVVDPTRRLARVRFDEVRLEDTVRIGVDDAGDVHERALDAARIALAADALGAAERALEEAVAYAKTREQFGRVIGSFQAVKHMCAEVLAELEPARALLWYAAFAWDTEREDARYVSDLIKSHATEVASEATTTCVQVYGGMGFTWECDMHLWFKRAGYDRQLFGSPSALRARAAEHALGH
jgi:alkylation response protein AidB-like acyl-CoA dehydrogenase